MIEFILVYLYNMIEFILIEYKSVYLFELRNK